jgi:hypothetical protein
MGIGIVKISYGFVALLCRCDSAFLSGSTLMLLTCIVWLKLVSYAHTTYDMRALAVSNDKVVISISINIRGYAICSMWFLVFEQQIPA